MSFKIINNEIYFTRQGETVRLSACGRNSIRFQASPNCRIEEQNWTLMPTEADAAARIGDNRAILEEMTEIAERISRELP